MTLNAQNVYLWLTHTTHVCSRLR